MEEIKHCISKKEIQERLNNLPEDRYIYQRYDGIIHKLKKIYNDHTYIDSETGFTIDTEKMAVLGKISENIIDLIEERRLCKWILLQKNR